MSTDGINIYTDAGITKIRDAAISSSQVRIKYISVGDANGSNYTPVSTQTALTNERIRVEIESYYPYDTNAWHVTATIPSDAITVDVREMGFHDENGELIALWAGPDITPRQTGVWEYVIDHAIVFGGIADGIITIDGTPDEVVEFMASTVQSLANIRLQQLEQSETIKEAILKGRL